LKSVKKHIATWGTAIGLALIAVLFIRIFVASPFVIPSQSMENTLFPGDYILVSKWQHGARLPQFPLQWTKSNGETVYSDLIDWGYTRLPALGAIEKNDLIAFGYPIDKGSIDQKTTMLKRAVGFPGDTISIIQGKVYINELHYSDVPTIKHYYVLISQQSKISHIVPSTSNPQRFAENSWKLELTKEEAKLLSTHQDVQELEQIIENNGYYNQDIYPSDEKLAWNTHNISSLFIPKKGSRVLLHTDNYKLYQKIIQDYEKRTIRIDKDKIYIDGAQVNSYTFTSDYYWMLGDNRDNSLDSRYWGFIPESHIIGKVSAVLFSWNKHKKAASPRWERSLSLIKKDGSLQEFRWVIYSIIIIFALLKILLHYVKR
jgi:signal peptidase I